MSLCFEEESDGSLQGNRVLTDMGASVTISPVKYAEFHIWDLARSLSAGL